VWRWDRNPARKWVAIRRCFAGALFPQNNGALESSSVSLEPDSRKKVGRWNPPVSRWNPYSRKKMGRWNPSVIFWNLEARRCSVSSAKVQRWNPSVLRWNPDSRKVMGRWNPPVFPWNLIPAKKKSRWNLTPLGTLKL